MSLQNENLAKDKNQDLVFNTLYVSEPLEIIKCNNENDVVTAITYCNSNLLKFRVRSGGHHHEGMCSADKEVVIDISGIETCEFTIYSDIKDYFPKTDSITDCSAVWLGAGLSNAQIFTKLHESRKIISVGSCSHVSVGGLTLGGGWNLLARKYGLTCDSLLAVQLVMADGEIKTVSCNHEPELFKALKGSGGGNFGIVTSFLFKTIDIDTIYSFSSTKSFVLQKDKYQSITEVKEWVNHQKEDTSDVTSFLTLYSAGDTVSMVIGGYCVKVEEENPKDTIKKQLGIDCEPTKIKKPYINYLTTEHITELNLTGSEIIKKIEQIIQEGDPFILETMHQLQSLLLGGKTAYSCINPTKHKVTSAFLKIGADEEHFVDVLMTYLKENQWEGDAFNMITLHALGGKVKEGDNSFYYKDRDFVIQIQSWWEKDDNSECLNWVQNFRKKLADENLIEGAFINFPDSSVSLDKYYGSKHDFLKTVKYKYDPFNRFNFQMSIPF